ncbi:Uncharacterized protein FWK35_00009226 [Aphis craccivora]|uniref:Uncharacterized protein n=2 Tax=Aphis craccivora TaxID=307492 RepID=A0A6G0YIH6_APHCR|nr:Uncharacterized protein FWK35_00009226 [Aphis craccivora]
MITCAPPYVSNHTLHSDLKILTVQEEAKNSYKLFRARLKNHSNPLILAHSHCIGRHTRMCCLRLTNVQHSKNCFARDNFSRTIFVVKLPNIHNTHAVA